MVLKKYCFFTDIKRADAKASALNIIYELSVESSFGYYSAYISASLRRRSYLALA